MKHSKTFFLAAGLTMLMACGSESEPDASVSMPGSDADEHGCRASAGYQWCEVTQQCERPWELAKKEGFEETEEAFEAFCSATRD